MKHRRTGPAPFVGSRVFARTGVALLAVLAVLVAVIAPVNAYEAPTNWSSSGGYVNGGSAVLTMNSGLTATVTGSGGLVKATSPGTYVAGTNTIGGRGYQTSDWSPSSLASGTGAAEIWVNPTSTNCPAVGTCSGLGSITITFSQPVANPILDLSGLGAIAYANTTPDNVIRGQSQYHSVLTLANAGVTLSKLSGGNLAVTGNTITTLNDNTGIRCDSTTSGSGTPTPSNAAAAAGCGSVQVNGTVTSLTFNMSMVFVANGANGLPGYGCTASGDVFSNGYVLTPPVCDPNAPTNQDAFALTVTVPQDYGDAPASYDKNGNKNNAAYAVLSDIMLGAGVTADNTNVDTSLTSPNASAAANLDAQDNGVNAASLTVATNATSYSTSVSITGASKSGIVCGWIDFNKNGIFDNTAERACANVLAGQTSATLTWSGLTGLTAGSTYARFRIGYNIAETQSPIGPSDAGEVEDYTFTITAPAPNINVFKTAGTVTGPDASGVYTATYTVTVQNTGSSAGTYGPLVDNPAFDINYTVQGASWTGASTGSSSALTAFQLAGSGTSIAAGTSQVYNVSIKFKYTGLGTPSACNGNPLAGLYNSVTATLGENGPTSDNSACDTPPANINITKTAGTVSGPDATGKFTATYQVKVINSGPTAGSYGALTDTPAFSSNIAVDGATWTTSGAGAPAGGSDATMPINLTTGTTAIAGSTTHTFNLTITFHYTDTSAPSACGSSSGGLFNAVAAASGETGATSDNSACLMPPANINVTKTAGTVAGPDASGNYTATYSVKVINSGLSAGTYGKLTDTPAYSSNLAPTSASWTTSGTGAPASGSATGAGPYSLAPAGTAIAASTTHTFTVTVTFHFTNGSNPTACGGPGSGLYNSVAVPAGQETVTTDDAACDTPPSRYTVFLKKVGKDGSGSTVALAGSDWTLQADASGAPGAVISNGVQPVAGQTGEFQMPSLVAGTYWLTETTAPAGYALLAAPIKFTVSATGTVTISGGSSSGISVQSTSNGPEIVVGDPSALTLPFAGGGGTKAFALGGAGLLLLAAVVALGLSRRRRTSSDVSPGRRVRR